MTPIKPNHKTDRVFICHAAPDQSEVVTPLASELRNSGIDVWYDKFELSMGDNIVDRTEDGLRDSSYAIVVFSHAFFEHIWTSLQFSALVTRLGESNIHRILPVRHGISQSELSERSPLVGAIVSISTAEPLAKVVAFIGELLGKPISPTQKSWPTAPKRHYLVNHPARNPRQICTDELDSLIEFFNNDKTICSIVGLGGSGKTSLLRLCYDAMSEELEELPVFWWGVAENASIEELLDALYRFTNLGRPCTLRSNWDKLHSITQQLAASRYVLIFDGFEEYQGTGHGGSVIGSIVRPEIRQLVQSVATESAVSKILISTRVPLTDLQGILRHQTIEPRPLSESASIKLLYAEGVADGEEVTIPVRSCHGHLLASALELLPALTLYTRTIPFVSYATTLLYGLAAGPVLALLARFVSLRGALGSTGLKEGQLASLYSQQQTKLLLFFSWMGFWIPLTVELGLATIRGRDDPSAALLTTGFLMPILSAGLGTVLLRQKPGPNPILP